MISFASEEAWVPSWFTHLISRFGKGKAGMKMYSCEFTVVLARLSGVRSDVIEVGSHSSSTVVSMHDSIHSTRTLRDRSTENTNTVNVT